VLFAPYWEDTHPDHVAASALADAAILGQVDEMRFARKLHFPQRIIYYFSIHLRIHPKPSFVVDVTDYL
jgi:LmbE family N-acetylglucosaminyl deacetylase